MHAGKINPPMASSGLVTRSRISEAISAFPDAKLVLICAPAGFGKTTVMLQCAARLVAEKRRTAWLTLDQGDNDLSRFRSSLERAMAGVIDSPGTSADDIVWRLSESSVPFSLFLDEFETIHDPGVLGLVRAILEILPTGAQLVIGSRHKVQGLGVARLRARGQMLEIDPAQLRFSAAEAAELLVSRRRIPLLQADVLRLHGKTEGWAAGLWLASVALEKNSTPTDFINRFSGADVAVSDYLMEEVLNQQPPPVRRFLLHTSVLKLLTPSLCRALLPDTDCEALLQQLSALGVLLTPIADEPQSYRYHKLFSSFLQAQLAREGPDEVPRLHRAAARWYQAQGRPIPALDHYLDSSDFDDVIALLDQHVVDLYLQGRLQLLARWFARIPERQLKQHTALQMMRLWVLGYTRGAQETLSEIQRLGLDGAEDPQVWPHVSALRPLLLLMLGRYEEAHSAGREALARLPSPVPFADSQLLQVMSAILLICGDEQDVRRKLSLIEDSGDDSRSAQTKRESVEGLLDFHAGRMTQAAARFRIAFDLSTREARQVPGNAWAGVLHAVALYEANDTEAAAHLLRSNLSGSREVGLADHTIQCYRLLARIAFDTDYVEHAFDLLAELELWGRQHKLKRVITSAQLERSRLLLLQGHVDAARAELARADDPQFWAPIANLRLWSNDVDYPALARVRLEAIAGDAAWAAQAVVHQIQQAEANGRLRRALALKLLQAMALDRAAGEDQALPVLASVLRECASGGFLRLVLDEGAPMARLVRRLLASSEYTSNRSLAAYLQRILTALGEQFLEEPSMPQGNVTLRAPFTSKEIRTLRLLAEGHSNKVLAEKLFVSESTVRTHLRNINYKLSVSTRTQAVTAARRLGILP